MRGFRVKCGERPLEVGGMWNSHEVPHERWCYENSGMHVGKYLVYAGLDYRIKSQDCRNVFLWLELLNWWVYKMRRCCGWRGWSMRKLEPGARLNIRRANMVKQGLMYSKQNWKWMLTRLWNNENIGSYIDSYEESNSDFRGGSSRSQPPCHPSMLYSKLLQFLYTYTGWECCKVELQS